jgi:hypothetical protein
MSLTPNFKLNTGATMPAIGTRQTTQIASVPDRADSVGLGGWAGMTKPDIEAASEWFLTALQVNITDCCCLFVSHET